MLFGDFSYEELLSDLGSISVGLNLGPGVTKGSGFK